MPCVALLDNFPQSRDRVVSKDCFVKPALAYAATPSSDRSELTMRSLDCGKLSMFRTTSSRLDRIMKRNTPD
jgi:hypothetical protein